MTEYGYTATGLTLVVMLIYGFIALVSNNITFDYRIFIGLIVFVAILETITNLIEIVMNN